MQKEKRLSAKERKLQIINAAMKVFATKGFQGTRTKDIAKSAGVSEATVFRFFRSKNDLYSAIISDKIIDQSKNINATQPDITNLSTILKNFFLHIIESNEKNPTFLRLMLYSALEEHKLAKNFVESHLLGEVNEFAKVIEKGINKEEYRDVNPKLTAQLFHYLVGGYCIERFVFEKNKNKTFNNEEVVETMVDILLNGLRK